jgi:Ca-activated chloride channel family protein
MNENTLNPTLILTPIRQAAPANGGTLEVLVRLQAPDRPASMASARQPLRLAVVIDRSGSMSGEPLQEALRCAEYIAKGLQPADRLTVVLYDDKVQVPVALRPGGDAAAIRLALAGVESGGNTALFDGWEAGAKILEGGAAGSLSRVLLLSDGQANHGLCAQADIERHCADWAARGVSTTTVGLGRNFNEDLMIGMARAGGGQQYYGQRAEDLHDGFDEELALLQSLYLRKVRVKVVPGAGVFAEPLGVIVQQAPGWYGLQDLAWGAEAWMMVRLHIAPSPAADPRQPQPLLVAIVEGELEGAQALQPIQQMLSLPMLAVGDLGGLPQDELVARRLKEVDFAEGMAQIRALAAQGDISAAEVRLARLEQYVADQPWLLEKAASLKTLLRTDVDMSVKEMQYSLYRTANRLVSKTEAAYLASETESFELPAFLRRKPNEGQGRKPR